MNRQSRKGDDVMQAYEFQSTVENGIIHIPDLYRDKIRSNVKVIVLSRDSDKSEISARNLDV
jgi:hypothetical protein